MSDLYSEQHRVLQRAFETDKLADRVKEFIVVSEITDDHKAFIESRAMFFLATVDHRGFPTCSHKGGEPGFVRVVDATTLAFPSYDGNGMFLSMGNLTANPRIGMLFIDFETPHRVRVHGTASIDRDDPLTASFHGAELVVRVAIEEIFVNCPRYIHPHRRIGLSKYTPQRDAERPVTPQWKRIDGLRDVLPTRDGEAVDELGCITPEAYEALVRQGKG
ncbi:pyridoxamine 5'-phosphate oxidase family protein [Nitrogeniibacter mangrovi]|uniref:Pyridoxamine 5'-phosphate oxidase family protein n=1 Tax=Nitrogeniibacter mangrovi TaxID=2016596 RepID=A0A6C1B764_9RHOO|nr:pyridoxamine 5'-phosphate oxidase family protein [Nitrogeniibacter mangrovi]QID19606.1 pyridoxamine 5'-phosphate oxidase family protein [Nitrogeniibacter mangrovi]